jgi:hypothetical protein
MVIDLENESYGDTFGNPASYLNSVLKPQGELLQNYYATGHVSLDNYIAQVSGQAPNPSTSDDCLNLRTFQGAYTDVSPGTPDPNQAAYPGQVDGQGCVYPKAVQTIGDQLDAAYPTTTGRNWRVYAEDMGNNSTRDGGTADPLGGTDCAHPASSTAVDLTNSAQAGDQYANRHNPFVYFHSVIDNPSTCNQNVVPLGTVTVGTNGAPDTFSGHLAQDLATPATTPRFSFVTPNLCNDGHDATCQGTNTEGGTTGGLTAANLWLKHWMPLILNSPAYQSGHMLVVITSDEGAASDWTAGDNEAPGPSTASPGPGYSPFLNIPFIPLPNGAHITYYQLLGVQLPANTLPGQTPPPNSMPGGGQVGALLLNPLYLKTGTTNTTSYDHYSALRTYEDVLGLNTGGADGQGHLGFSATATSFGTDVFTNAG